jgi:serine protease
MGKPAPLLLILLALAALTAWVATSRLHAQEPSSNYALLMSPAQVQAFLTAREQHLGYIPGQTLVKFRAGMGPADQTRALTALRRGTTANASMKWIGDALLVDTPNDPDSVAVAATLARQPEVEWAQPNYLRKRTTRPNDTSYSLQWNMDLIGMPAAWDVNKGSSSAITIAVVDSGITTANTTLSFPLWTGQRFETVAMPFRISPDIASGRIQAGRDFVFLRNTGPVVDMDGHGTLVASVAAQETNNSLGTAGVAYQTTLLPLKVCLGYWEIQVLLASINQPGFIDPEDAGGCPDDAIAQAIRFAADSGAQVINVSLGGGGGAPILRDALAYAVSRGSFVALSGGNEFNDGNPVSYPAAYAEQIDGAMAVGAITRSSKRAPYSSTGSFIEIVAPGGDFDDGGLNGLVTQVGLEFLDFLPSVVQPRFDRYALISVEGTSVATPHVAGVAAMLAAQGVRSPSAIEAMLRSSATNLGPPGRDDEYGFGLVNARAAVRGMGLVK